MRVSIGLFVIVLLGSTRAAQSPRAPVAVGEAYNYDRDGWEVAAAACEGDLTAVAYTAGQPLGFLGNAWISVSDGRGLTWSPPKKLNLQAGVAEARLQRRSVSIVGDHVYACWGQARYALGIFDLFFNASHDRGQSLLGETRLDFGPPVGSVDVTTIALAGTRDGGLDRLYVAVGAWEFATGTYYMHYMLLPSEDGGLSFGASRAISSSGPSLSYVDGVDLHAEGSTLHVVWCGRQLTEVDGHCYYRRSSDGGASWDAPDLVLDPGLTGSGGQFTDLDVAGSTVAVTWIRNVHDRVCAAVSLDGGNTWSAPHLFLDLPPGLTGGGSPQVSIQPDGRIVVAWADDRTGVGEVRVSSSTDGGRSWSPETQVSMLGSGARVLDKADLEMVRGAGDCLALAWTAGAPPRVYSALSRDGGATWGPDFAVTDNVVPAEICRTRLVGNQRYGNFVHLWKEAASGCGSSSVNVPLMAGGYRPPTLTPAAPFVAGSTASIDLELFSGDEPLAFVLASGGPGSLLLGYGDGRDVGLAFDDALLATVRDPGIFLVGLDPNGSGNTPSFPIPVALAGTTFHWAAVSLGLGPLTFGEITDVVAIPIQ